MIKIKDLVKVYRTEEVETTAINKLNIEIKEGEFVSIMGPSGCGKSSLVKAGLIPKLDNNSLFQNAGWECLTIRPGKTPLQTLKKTIGEENPIGDLQQVSHEKKRFLLVVDQLEELFTVTKVLSAPLKQAVDVP